MHFLPASQSRARFIYVKVLRVFVIDYEEYCLLNVRFCNLVEITQNFEGPRSHPLQVRRIFHYSTPRTLRQQGLVTTSINFDRTARCHVDGRMILKWIFRSGMWGYGLD
jgi:hypothetical protein